MDMSDAQGLEGYVAKFADVYKHIDRELGFSEDRALELLQDLLDASQIGQAHGFTFLWILQ